MTSFLEKWLSAQQQNTSRLALGLAPQLSRMPAPLARYDDPFLPFGKAILAATADKVCAVVFDLASYLALGAAGAVALERTIPHVPDHIPTILHAPFSTPDFARAAFEEAFDVDAVTLATGNIEVVRVYTAQPQHGVFVNAKAAMAKSGDNVGFYDADGFELGGRRVMWVTEPILYASGRADFEEAARQAAEKHRIESLK